MFHSRFRDDFYSTFFAFLPIKIKIVVTESVKIKYARGVFCQSNCINVTVDCRSVKNLGQVCNRGQRGTCFSSRSFATSLHVSPNFPFNFFSKIRSFDLSSSRYILRAICAPARCQNKRSRFKIENGARARRLDHSSGDCFVPGDSNTGLHKRNIYEHNGIVCSQKRALCVATVVFAILFAISLIIAFAGPQNGSVTFPLIFYIYK